MLEENLDMIYDQDQILSSYYQINAYKHAPLPIC